jgi:mannosyltransferase OCH1-like enzyme
VEGWWQSFVDLHPDWQLNTWRDPLDPEQWPETGDLWDRCQNGAQKAGLIRLEALWTHGGIYVDSDMECYRPLDPLLGNDCFVAAWEDAKTIPDAFCAAPPRHPVTAELLDAARRSVERGDDAWHSGPGVFTATLPHAAERGQALLLPPQSVYPYHWRNKVKDRKRNHKAEPWALAAHHWDYSWESK